MRFTATDGKTYQDVTLCPACGCVSTDLDLTVCAPWMGRC